MQFRPRQGSGKVSMLQLLQKARADFTLAEPGRSYHEGELRSMLRILGPY